MENLLKIKPAGATQFNNSEYTNFMKRIEEKLRETGVELLGLTADFLNNFSKNLRLMDDIVMQSRVDADTKELSKFDIQRDSLWIYIYTSIESASRLEIDYAEKEAGVALLEQIKPYKKLHQLPNMQETQQIRSLITDLQKPQNVPHITTLRLLTFVEDLYTINESYATVTDRRTEVRINVKLPDSKTVRLEIDKQYQYMTDIVFAKNISTPNEQTSKFIIWINQLIFETKAAYHQRSPKKKANS